MLTCITLSISALALLLMFGMIVKIGCRQSATVGCLVYRMLIDIFDFLDDGLRWAHPFNNKLEDKSVESDQWSDAEVLKRFDKSATTSMIAFSVAKISDDTVVKVTVDLDTPHLEASLFDFVRRCTTIPIPRVRRKFVDEDSHSVIVTDYIPGERLDHVWPSLSFLTKLWVALILRRYIRQLRQIKDSHSSVPGPVADSPQKCWGHMFYRRCGPFPDYASLSAFYNRKLDEPKALTGNTIRSTHPDTEPFDDSMPLVFTNGGLHMRNIVFGRDGRLWIVNWSQSGFYPQWFEFVSTVYAAKRDMAPKSWTYLIPFIADQADEVDGRGFGRTR